MKSILLFLALISVATQLFAQNIGIGTNTPHASAQLDVSSTTKGMLAPRMTTVQRTAIAGPVKGLLVYDTDLNSLYHYNGSSWAAVGAGGGGFSLPFEGTVNLGIPGFKVTNAGAGAAIHATTTNEFGYGLYANNTTAYGYSVYGYSRSPNAISIYGIGDSSTGVKAESAKGLGLDAISTDSTALRARIIKGANTDPAILATHAGGGIAVDASSVTGSAIRGVSSTTTASIIGNNNNGSTGNGVYGTALGAGGAGVRGESTAGTGVLGYSNNNIGVSAGTLGGTALYASSVSGAALKGSSSSGYSLDVSGKVKIAGGNTNPAAGAVLTSVDASGNAVWKTSKIGFEAASSPFFNQTNVADEATIILEFDENPYDPGDDFNLNSAASNKNTFIVPVNGFYHFDAACRITLNSTTTNLQDASISIYVNDDLMDYRAGFAPNNSTTDSNMPMSISSSKHLNAGDKITIQAFSNNLPGLSVRIDNKKFSGFLVFAD